MRNQRTGPTRSRSLNRSEQARRKTKTGCITCRIRKIKCDEGKPYCLRCLDTGRTCDGYQSLFRQVDTTARKSRELRRLDELRPTATQITAQDVYILSRCFSTKTMYDVQLDCDEEARRVLEASLTDPAIQDAVRSLRALREGVDTSGDGLVSAVQQTPGYDEGIQHYCSALKSLASNLSSSGSKELKSALLCCQIFISIEQVRGDYAIMVEHIIRGLRIMQEHRARPCIKADGKLASAHSDHMPLLDVFIIKLFAAPCKFADTPTAAKQSACPLLLDQSCSRNDLRTLAPNMRTELCRIAASTLDFLDKVSKVKTLNEARKLYTRREALISSLHSWLVDVDTNQKGIDAETLSVSFMRLFYLILKVILSAALEDSPPMLKTEIEQLQTLATDISKRVAGYRIQTRQSP